MKCFYHKSDLDGHCSGAIVKHQHPICEMIGVDYNDPAKFSTIGPKEIVFVVDFSFSVDDMCILADRADLIWIDHHKSAIEKMDHVRDIKGLREIGQAGCELTWRYLYGSDIPLAVTLLGRYDVWDHADVRVLPFQYGMRTLEDSLPGSSVWPALLNGCSGPVERLLDKGKLILDYQGKQDAMYAAGMAYETTFHGYRALVINRPFSNSKVLDTVYDPNKHDIMVLFGVKPGQVKYSLFCSKPEIDVSKIATKYGGGGHAGAAGFYAASLIDLSAE